jgi:hypothetical protein
LLTCENAYAERFVRSIKEECLSRMLFIGQASLRRAVDEYVAHYLRERNLSQPRLDLTDTPTRLPWLPARMSA